MMKKFTLVSTVFNEMARLLQTIADIEAQTLQPDEIVITDAGSTDGTFEALIKWSAASAIKIRILMEKGCNVARGRNLAIQASSYDLIASTDFGCRFHPDWLSSIIKPFDNDDIRVVGGAFAVDESEVKTLAAKADYILSGGYEVRLDDSFSVSSRSIAYYKSVWTEVGKYPEWLTLAADDTIFWRKVKQHKFEYRLIYKPYVLWVRHQTLRGFSKEAFRYGLGDGESCINFRNFWSHVIETGLRYTLFVSLVFFVFLYHLFGGFFIAVLIVQLFGLRSYKNAFVNWWRLKSKKYHLGVLLFSFVQTEYLRVWYLKGYLKGLFSKPLKHNDNEAVDLQ